MKFLSLNTFTFQEEVINEEETKKRLEGYIQNPQLALLLMEKDSNQVYETPKYNIRFHSYDLTDERYYGRQN